MNAPRILLALGLAIGVVAVLSGCGSDGNASGDADSTATDIAQGSMESDAENVGQTDAQKPDSEDDEKKKKRKEKSTSVQASEVFRGDLVIGVTAEGAIRARNTAEIHAEIGGKIVRIHAQEGQSVRRGQMILKLDGREYEAEMEEARASYLQALSLLSIEEDDIDLETPAKETRDEFNNLRALEQQGKITREERIAREIQLDIDAIKQGKFRYEVAAARSGVSVARAAMERARIKIERTEIRAPFSGVITELTLSPGELIAANQTICSLVDNVNIEAEVGVLEADLGHVTEGKPALLEIPALETIIPVTVDVVSPQFDRETRTCQVLLRLKNEDGLLRPGMFVRAQIAGETFEERMLVPREAILSRDGRPLLFKVEDGRAKWLYIKPGKTNDYLVEIDKVLQGGTLEPGDKVVVSDHLTLAHDAKVKVKKTLPASDPWVSLAEAPK